mgnify:CR=1 FL=1
MRVQQAGKSKTMETCVETDIDESSMNFQALRKPKQGKTKRIMKRRV